MELPKEQHHLGDDSREPKLTLTVKGSDQISTLFADGTSNSIASMFDIHVVASRLRAKATKHNMGKFTTATASLEISDLVLVNTIPSKAQHAYDVTTMRGRFGASGKAIRNLEKTLGSPTLADSLIGLFGLMDKIDGVRIRNEINEITELLRIQPGTADSIRIWADGAIAPRLEAIDAVKALADALASAAVDYKKRIDALLSALQISFLYMEDKKTFKEACKYLSYVNEKQSFDDIISAFGSTWKKVRPVERKGSLIVHFPAAMHISNGQRDSLCFAAELRKIERASSARDAIIIIDEVFDYLDDANLVAVQYYITRLIKKFRATNRNIYPLILTHLNPYYFKNFTFSNQKIYFLKKSIPAINKDFRTLISKRKDQAIKDNIDHYYLHYDPAPINIREKFKAAGVREEWGDSTAFHAHTEAEWKKYLNESDHYDPFAVCCFVRVQIERIIYLLVPDSTRKAQFINTSMTKNKLDFAVDNGIEVDDTLYLLGIIYNEGMHIHENVDDSSPIVSKLENRTIRHMLIESISQQV
jgi:hypothetical protein